MDSDLLFVSLARRERKDSNLLEGWVFLAEVQIKEKP